MREDRWDEKLIQSDSPWPWPTVLTHFRVHQLPLATASCHDPFYKSPAVVKLTIALITDRFSGPGWAIGPLCACVCLCVRPITFEINNLWPRYVACWLIFSLSRWSSKVKVIDQISLLKDENCSFFGYGYKLRRDVLLVICRVLCAKVVSATSSEGFLVWHNFWTMHMPIVC